MYYISNYSTSPYKTERHTPFHVKKEFTTNEGRTICRLSNWLTIHHAYNVRANNQQLGYYRTDENGYRDGQNGFDPTNGTYCDYFTFKGRKYAIDRFFRSDYPIFFENEDGKTSYIAGYDSEEYYQPLMIEVSEDCEHVRVFIEPCVF